MHPVFKLTPNSPTTAVLSRAAGERQANPQLSAVTVTLNLDRFYAGLLWFSVDGLPSTPFEHRSRGCESSLAIRANQLGYNFTALAGAKSGQVTLDDRIIGIDSFVRLVVVGRVASGALREAGLITAEEESFLDNDGVVADGAERNAELLTHALLAGVQILPITERPDIWSEPKLTGFSIRLMNSSEHLVVGVSEVGLPALDRDSYTKIARDIGRLPR